MKTDKEIFDDYCDIVFGHPINVPGHIENVLYSYGFLTYKCKIRVIELIDTIKQTIFKQPS